jgi:3'(2'), 5'-bisphosphate nucleotidase
MSSRPQRDVEGLLQPVSAIVRRATAAILRVYAKGDVTATKKGDASPLTEADLASHALIVEGLSELTPGVPVLSEESAIAAYAERRRWSSFWLVDPLDGTKEFLARNGEFTVNVALIDGHDPVLGVVGVPARDLVYAGAPGHGATKVEGSTAPRTIATRRPAADPIRVVGSRSHRDATLDSLLARLGRHDLIVVGSALKFCIVAEGGADFYPRLGPTSEWDTAAAHAVLLAAGGDVVSLDGQRLQYNARDTLLNPPFLAFGDPNRDWIAPFRP